jgi:hypothetical protein
MMAKKGGQVVPQVRFRFTLRQLGLLIALFAVIFASLRTPAGVLLLIMVGPVLPGFILGRIRGGTGIGGGMLSAALTSGGYGLACYLYDCFFHNPANVVVPALLPFLFFVLIMGLIWGIFISIILYIILTYTIAIWQKPLKEDACGPIVWRGLDGHRQPPSAAPRGSWMRGGHA